MRSSIFWAHAPFALVAIIRFQPCCIPVFVLSVIINDRSMSAGIRDTTIIWCCSLSAVHLRAIKQQSKFVCFPLRRFASTAAFIDVNDSDLGPTAGLLQLILEFDKVELLLRGFPKFLGPLALMSACLRLFTLIQELDRDYILWFFELGDLLIWLTFSWNWRRLNLHWPFRECQLHFI